MVPVALGAEDDALASMPTTSTFLPTFALRLDPSRMYVVPRFAAEADELPDELGVLPLAVLPDDGVDEDEGAPARSVLDSGARPSDVDPDAVLPLLAALPDALELGIAFTSMNVPAAELAPLALPLAPDEPLCRHPVTVID